MAASLRNTISERPYLAAAGALGLIIGTIAYRDYQNYVALGPHGLPDTFWGWYKQLKMSTKSRKDVTTPAPYDINVVAGPFDINSYLPQDAGRALKWRPGNKMPQIPNFVAPQRQISGQASETMKDAMFSHLDGLVAANGSSLQTQTSILEGPIPALGIKDFNRIPEADKPRVLRFTRGEISHIHPPDGSTHLIMSLTDQKRIIELGWGRRHRLSGGGILPWNYTFIYAPRNQTEFEVWKLIVEAAVQFCISNVSVEQK